MAVPLALGQDVIRSWSRCGRLNTALSGDEIGVRLTLVINHIYLIRVGRCERSGDNVPALFSPRTMWVTEIEFRFSGLAAHTFIKLSLSSLLLSSFKEIIFVPTRGFLTMPTIPQ